ncbi:DUF4254 domain-containing protein [Massilia terrae]|uniref:DUF4254 domain-containing protein n=1 Tax=Massilia terrae TaxID=1811224 RepID=A0ABT2D169_9BURK|nr:DUF4254 domain-containing protein [Massilia terrae]MCS0659971.1 DUF4254 domain-containing protein [Massilia terrae]
MHSMLDAWSIVRFHDRELARPGWPQPPSADLAAAWRPIAANHRCNCQLWQEEDRVRRRDVPAADIADGKRRIDGHNQQRNDAVEAIDEAILAELAHVRLRGGARLSSETAGAMIDRLSILALKVHHMRLQSQRAPAGQAHVQLCGAKLERLEAQRADLAACLDRLLREARSGETYFKVYRQFKMYNDASLNPYLYGPDGAGAGGTVP